MDIFFSQLIALITFFLYPVIQYVGLKQYAKNEGMPQLWYLPDYGFRLVIRNIPGKKTLSNITYRTFIRHIIPSSNGSSVATFEDKHIFDAEDMFLFPGTDQILFSFKLLLNNNGNFAIRWTEKLGTKKNDYELEDDSIVIVDYEANIKNWFNFDIKVAKRIEMECDSLHEMWQIIQEKDIEQSFVLNRIISVE